MAIVGSRARIVRTGVVLGLAIAALAPNSSAAPGNASSRTARAAAYFRSCGNYPALRVGIETHRVSCAVARSVVKAYLHGKGVGVDFHRVKAFPAWTCSTGDRSGGCSKGKFAVGVPEIDFFYLDAPG